METTLRMSMKERMRLEIFSRVKRGGISLGKAALLARVSRRQAKRIWRRYRLEGDAGLVHRLRGRPGNAGKVEVRDEVLALCRVKYADFGSALAAEYLLKEGQEVSRQTLWRWRRQAGDLQPSRRASRHRARRERRGCVGELVQMDGSTHDWFEGRRGPCVLFVMIDDAMGRVFCRFYESEDTVSAFDLFGRYVKKQGLPMALYVDKDSIYRVNDPLAREQGHQRGRMPLTQFGRAMGQLGVELICANSPQAKGRVERANGTLQDRLVKALRVAGISTIQEANEFLQRQFLPEHNRHFMRDAAHPVDMHRKVPSELVLQEVLSVQENRTVGRDWCVAHERQVLQLDKRHERLSLVGREITVLKLASGQLRLMYRGKRLRWRQAAAGTLASKGTPPKAVLTSKPIITPKATVTHKPWRPPPDHPWRSPLVKPAPLREASLRSASLRSAGLTSLTGGQFNCYTK
jgi:transposase